MVLINCQCGCKAAAEEHKIIDCTACKKSFIHCCVDLTSIEIRTIKTKKGLSWSCRNFNIINNEINKLREATLRVKNEIVSLRKSDMDQSMFEQIFAELNDRNNCKQNIILFDVSKIQSNIATVRNSHES